MNGSVALLLVVLFGPAAPLHTTDLQVEAVSAAGAALPELAEAVARALLAGGARVVLRGPSSGPCEYCAIVKVTETGAGACRVEVRSDQRTVSTTLHLPAGSMLFDRARAIAIQTQLLIPAPAAESKPEVKAKEVAARPARKAEARGAAEPARPVEPAPSLGRQEAMPYLASPRGLSSAAEPEPIVVSPVSPVSSSSSVATVPSAPSVPSSAVTRAPIAPPTVTYTARGEGRPEVRAQPRGETGPGEAGPAVRPEPRIAGRAEPVPPAEPSKPAEAVKPAAPVAAEAPAKGVDLRAGLPEGWRQDRGRRRWPWIPTALGAGAAVAAGICAVVARSRYNALGDRTQSLSSALSEKSSGESWQNASYVLAGAATVGVAVGVIGFVARGPGSTSVGATPLPGGGVVALAGALP